MATLDHHTTARPGPRQGLRWGLQGHRKAGAATAKSSARLFRRPNRRTTIALTASAVVILAVIALAIPTMAHQDSHPSQTMPPFPGLDDPWGVTVDYAGNLYVSDSNNLTADSSTTTEVPFTGLNNPAGVAMSGTGTLYVVDGGNNNGRVLQLTGGER